LWIGGLLAPYSILFKEGVRLKRKFVILILLFGFIFLANKAVGAISVILTGSWSLTITSSDLISGAGSDLKSDYESAADAVSISISGTTGASDNWRVDVEKIDTNWPNSLNLYIKRTSDGTGGSVSGGTSYQQITDVNQTFFSGSGDVSWINVQLKLNGVSIQISPDNYTTTVYYTVVDI